MSPGAKRMASTMRTVHLTLTSALLLAVSPGLGVCEGESRPPNVVLFLADDLGYNDLSSYRTDRPYAKRPSTARTPAIDGLVGAGLRFTDFYAGAPVCSPSRGALLTGRNPTRLGIYNWIPGDSPMHLRSEEITIAEMLRHEGYATGHFGKWHLAPAKGPHGAGL
jgi:arylsulfatase A